MRRTTTLGLAALLLAATAFDAVAQGKPSRTKSPRFTQGLRYPSLTPDGEQVVFGYRGDIWVAPVDGDGPARRLTLHEAQDTLPRVSPDGKTVAFSSMREGNYDIYLVPITGGLPRRLTFHSGYEILCDWSPDGKHILFISPREVGWWGRTSTRCPSTAGRPVGSRAPGAARAPTRPTASGSSTRAA